MASRVALRRAAAAASPAVIVWRCSATGSVVSVAVDAHAPCTTTTSGAPAGGAVAVVVVGLVAVPATAAGSLSTWLSPTDTKLDTSPSCCVSTASCATALPSPQSPPLPLLQPVLPPLPLLLPTLPPPAPQVLLPLLLQGTFVVPRAASDPPSNGIPPLQSAAAPGSVHSHASARYSLRSAAFSAAWAESGSVLPPPCVPWPCNSGPARDWSPAQQMIMSSQCMCVSKP